MPDFGEWIPHDKGPKPDWLGSDELVMIENALGGSGSGIPYPAIDLYWDTTGRGIVKFKLRADHPIYDMDFTHGLIMSKAQRASLEEDLRKQRGEEARPVDVYADMLRQIISTPSRAEDVPWLRGVRFSDAVTTSRVTEYVWSAGDLGEVYTSAIEDEAMLRIVD